MRIRRRSWLGARSIDPYLGKIEELVEACQGRIRADVLHDKLTAMGYDGTARTTRRGPPSSRRPTGPGTAPRVRPGGTSHTVGEIPEPGMWPGVRLR
ncbi:hypothetical protein ACH47B_01900 [Rhodococcus sp. NPDC019627]|uniref:hypothetical protein n=1 Tax=unclassified Rhodococcus (in: high G+C Gram-positive bacteria) TaxID=192944 RepID=UPI0033E9C6F3